MSARAVTSIMFSSRVRGIDRLVLLTLAWYANDHGRGIRTIEEIASAANLDRRSIQRVMRRLEEAGVVKVATGGGRGKPSIYEIVLPKEAP